MAISGQEPIRIGQPNESANSDSLFQAFSAIQNNFTTVFNTASNVSTVAAGNGIQVTNSGNGVIVTNSGVTKLVAGENVTITNLDGSPSGNGALVISSTGTGGNGGGSVTSVGICSNTLTVSNTPVIGAGNINVNLPILTNVAGSYRNPNVTVDTTGRVVAIANGSIAGTVTSVAVQAGNGLSVSGSPITTSGTINIINTGVTSIVAGPGIAVNQGNGAVTITNTGGGGNGSGGTVTRVAVCSNTLSVTGSPIITSGNINIELPQNLVANNIQANTANISNIFANTLSLYSQASGINPELVLVNFFNGVNGPKISSNKARGNISSPQPVQINDDLITIQGFGRTRFNQYQGAGGMVIYSAGEPNTSSSRLPSGINLFSTDSDNIHFLKLLSSGNVQIPGALSSSIGSNVAISTTEILGRSRGTVNNPEIIQIGDSIERSLKFGYTGNGTSTINGVDGYSFSGGTFRLVVNIPTVSGQFIPSDYYIRTVSNSNVSLDAIFTHTGNFSIPETFIGNGVNLTGNISAVNGSFSNSFSVVNTIFSNSISANTISGTLTTTSQPNINQVGTLSNLIVSGNVNASNFIGNVIGNISGNIQVPGVDSAIIYNDNGLANASPNFTFNDDFNVMTVNGNITANNVTANNVTANNVTANLFTGTLVTGTQPNITSVGTLNSLSVTGNISANNVTAGLFTGTLVTGAQPNITSIGTLSSLSVSGNISANNVTANLFTGTLVTGAQPNITSIGTLSSLSVTGNIITQNITSNGNVITESIQLTGNTTANSTATVTATYPIVIDGIAYKLMLTQ